MLKKKAIGDSGYSGHHKVISTYNAHDLNSVKLFKSRALKQHKAFNGMTKSFGIIQTRFRHGSFKVGIAFEAVCVICQYKIESEEPLFDVLIQDVLNASEEDLDSDIDFLDGEEEDCDDDIVHHDRDDESDDKRDNQDF